MRFSVVYRPTALFSLRDSNSTSSGAKSLFLPSPYAIKMAFINQAISVGGEDFNSNNALFSIIRDAKITYYIQGCFCMNNCFVKIQKKRSDSDPFMSTVSYREYAYLNKDIEIIFDVQNENCINSLKRYLYLINQFGKRGCFCQFVRYNDCPPESNVSLFNVSDFKFGILQEFDDFENNVQFENVNNYSETETKRKKLIYLLPLVKVSSSKAYSLYKVK